MLPSSGASMTFRWLAGRGQALALAGPLSSELAPKLAELEPYVFVSAMKEDEKQEHSCPKAGAQSGCVVKIVVIASCRSDISALDSYHRNRCNIKNLYKCCYFDALYVPTL